MVARKLDGTGVEGSEELFGKGDFCHLGEMTVLYVLLFLKS